MYAQNAATMFRSLAHTREKWKHSPVAASPHATFLTMMACHTSSIEKLKAAITTLRQMRFATNTLVVINSSDACLHDVLERWVKTNMPDVQYYSVPNASTLDSGKWYYYLTTHYKPQYNWVVFTNDSFITTGSVNHYFNMMSRSNVELYGYNDSTMETYHYQSYLFGICRDSIHKFVSHFEKVQSRLVTYMDVVRGIELMLTRIVKKHDCFLHIARIPDNVEKNVFFNHDALYIPLLRMGLLPFYKLRRSREYHKHQKKLVASSTRLSLANGMP